MFRIFLRPLLCLDPAITKELNGRPIDLFFVTLSFFACFVLSLAACLIGSGSLVSRVFCLGVCVGRGGSMGRLFIMLLVLIEALLNGTELGRNCTSPRFSSWVITIFLNRGARSLLDSGMVRKQTVRLDLASFCMVTYDCCTVNLNCSGCVCIGRVGCCSCCTDCVG